MKIRSMGAALAAWVLCAQFGFAAPAVGAEPQVIKIWPEGVPGVMANGGAEALRLSEQGDHVVSNVHDPSLTVYLAGPKAGGTAVIVIPGGGHRELWTDHEGHNVARFLAAHGISAFILKYRLARAPNSTYTIEGDALNDVRRAIRVVRAMAPSFKVDPNKVGVIGFSAGGQLALLSAMRPEAGADTGDLPNRQSSRPDFAALVYPGSWADVKIDAQTPPMFLLCGSDDRPEVVSGVTNIYSLLRAAKVPAELHLYDGVPHGFGLRDSLKGPVAHWPTQFVEWLQVRKVAP